MRAPHLQCVSLTYLPLFDASFHPLQRVQLNHDFPPPHDCSTHYALIFHLWLTGEDDGEDPWRPTKLK